MLARLAQESGIRHPRPRTLDRKRKGKKLNQDWVSKSDPEAKMPR